VSDQGKTGKNFQVLLRAGRIALKEDIWYYEDWLSLVTMYDYRKNGE
jgi:hypothetical protein